MELQASIVEESPVVTLGNGSQVSRGVYTRVMACIEQLHASPSSDILFMDLIAKCKNVNHEFYDKCQWKLSELGFLDTDGHVPLSVRDIVLSLK